MDSALYALATDVGVLTSYHDWKGRLCEARPDVLLRVLQLVGVDIDHVDQAVDARHAYHRAEWQRLVQPCAVAWDGGEVKLYIRVPANTTDPYSIHLEFEAGHARRHTGYLGELEVVETMELDGQRYEQRAITLSIGEHGYHRATVEVGERRAECFIISAPTAAYRMPRARRWGVFAPLYAVHGDSGSGAGDLADLLRMARWTRDLGGSFVGTLPLLAAYLTEPFEPSPYSPVSRLFWNELYLNPAAAPGLDVCPEAQATLASPAFAAEADELHRLELVDYRRQMAHKRGVLEALAEAAWGSDALRGQIEAYMKRHPRADDYARFRAVTEARGRVWMDWPEPLRGGSIGDGDFDERIRRYHLYVQYAMDAQIARMDEPDAASLYLDLPVGVNRGGYDVWRDREAFVMEASAGAPPDPLFSDGQNWGLPPLHPHRMRERGYRYLIECIRHHVEHAGLLRVDHVMGLHRLFWIPEGVDTKDGVYVHYPAGEMYAIISLESHRNGCEIIGEDLGTVPEYVRPSMRHHGMSRLYVAQFSLPSGGEGTGPEQTMVTPPPSESVASLNTHDTPMFAGYWHGKDIDDFLDLGIIETHEAEADHRARRATCAATARFLADRGLLDVDEAGGADLMEVMRALMEYLGGSEAEMVMVNLEDLWLETRPHNVPGTSHERPNWRRKMRYSLDELTADERVLRVLERLQELRGGTK